VLEAVTVQLNPAAAAFVRVSFTVSRQVVDVGKSVASAVLLHGQ